MAECRAYILGDDGHFTGFESLVCTDDAEALDKAKRLAVLHSIELWCGARLVARLPDARSGTVTHEIHQGRMVPKQAT